MNRSVHDNRITSYVVDCQKRSITLHTVYQDKEPWEYTDVKFTGVLAHLFHHVLEHNILFDIEEVSPQEIITENRTLFADSWKWGWPEVEYRGNLDRLIEELSKKQINGYLLQSSCGCCGWVLAETCERVSCDEVKATTWG